MLTRRHLSHRLQIKADNQKKSGFSITEAVVTMACAITLAGIMSPLLTNVSKKLTDINDNLKTNADRAIETVNQSLANSQ